MPSKNSKNYHKKPFVLGEIFEKKDHCNYKPNALLYQNILEFIFERKDENKPGIRFNDLAKWLMYNNLEFREYYSDFQSHVTMSNRIANRKRKIQDSINNLIHLKLMFEFKKTQSLKNNTQTMLYGYTVLGQIAALLIRYNQLQDEKLKEKLADMIIDKIMLFYQEVDSYMSDFIVQVYKKAIELNYNKKIIESLTYIIKDEQKIIQNFVDVLNLLFYGHWELSLNYVDFNTLIVDTLKDLGQDSSKYILFHLKNTIEGRIANNLPPKDWTTKWIENISDHSVIILYGTCNNCKKKYPSTIDHDFFIKQRRNKIIVDCEYCGSSNSVLVDFPYEFRKY